MNVDVLFMWISHQKTCNQELLIRHAHNSDSRFGGIDSLNASNWLWLLVWVVSILLLHACDLLAVFLLSILGGDTLVDHLLPRAALRLGLEVPQY